MPSRTNTNYQSAGVSGINFAIVSAYFNSESGKAGVNYEHVILNHTLYFEYPAIRNSNGRLYSVASSLAASFAAASTDAAIEATEEYYSLKDLPGPDDIIRTFESNLRIIMQAGGRRLTTVPNYSPVLVRPYSTL
jgi:hypothetical protein